MSFQQIDVPPETATEDQSHIENMVAKAEGAESQQPDQQPEKLLAGKYKTEDELNKGIIELLKQKGSLEDVYKALEKDQGKLKSQSQSTDNTGSETTQPDKTNVEKVVENVGLDFDVLAGEYNEIGSLSDESYQKFEKAGIKREIVDAYIEGQKAIAERNQDLIYQTVGGAENYQAMIDWAVANLSPKEKSAYNNAINGDTEQIKLAVEGLSARYVKANGNPPKQLIQGDPPSVRSGAYQSRAEMIRDMQDPKYQTDPAFRQMVHNKLAKSTVI